MNTYWKVGSVLGQRRFEFKCAAKEAFPMEDTYETGF